MDCLSPRPCYIYCLFIYLFIYLFNSDPVLHIPRYTPSAGIETPISSSVPQMTIFSTISIDSTTITTTHITRTASTAVPNNLTSPPRVSIDSSSQDTKRLSTLLIVTIAVSCVVAAVASGLAVSCYIWRKRRNIRFALFFHFLNYFLV